MSRARWWIEIALVAIGAALIATVYEPFFGGPGYLWRVLPFAPLAALVCLVGARLRPIPATAVGTLAFAVGAIELVARDTLRHGLPTAATATASGRALVGGWAAMLSVATPAGLTIRLLMTPALVTFLTVVGAAVLARRTRNVLAPVAPLVAAELVALPMVANQPGTRWAEAAALLAVLSLLVLARAMPVLERRPGYGSRRAIATRVLAGLTVAAAVVVAGTVVAAAQPYVRGGHRYDPRDLVRPPVRVHAVLNPLSGIAAQIATSPARTMFTVSGAPAGTLMPTSVLDGFDGSGWHTSGTYLVAGPALAAGPALPHSTTVTARVAITGLDGPYLPVIGRPTLIESRLTGGAEIGFDTTSGVVVTDGVHLAGSAYTVTGLHGSRGPGLARAETGGGSTDTGLADVPASLDRLAAQITASDDGPYAAATAIETYLRTMPYSPGAATGGSYGLLERMLLPASPTDFAGDIGAHAAAFAVLARSQGLPVRIAIGYRVPTPLDGMSIVTTESAYAWDQVFFQGYGWVDFDPTDATRTTVTPQVPPIVPSTVPVAQSTDATPPPSEPSSVEPGVRSPSRHTPLAVLTYLLIALAGVLALAIACNALAKALRRRHRRLGDPSSRVVGAWLEAVDYLAMSGAPIDAAMTCHEVAMSAADAEQSTLVGRRLRRAAPALAHLAPRASEAIFSGMPSSPDRAALAWREVRSLPRTMYPGWSTLLRVTHLFIPIRPPRRSRLRPSPGGTP